MKNISNFIAEKLDRTKIIVSDYDVCRKSIGFTGMSEEKRGDTINYKESYAYIFIIEKERYKEVSIVLTNSIHSARLRLFFNNNGNLETKEAIPVEMLSWNNFNIPSVGKGKYVEDKTACDYLNTLNIPFMLIGDGYLKWLNGILKPKSLPLCDKEGTEWFYKKNLKRIL